MTKKTLTGINVQFPISRLIAEGRKTIETRTYPIPENYVGTEMALVETPGKSGKFKSRIIAIIKFGRSFKYESKSKFYADYEFHFVTRDSPWAWDSKKGKWGWPIEYIFVLPKQKSITKRLGIKYTKNFKV